MVIIPCSLSGTLPKAIAAANFLTQLRLGNNKLAGTVVSGLRQHAAFVGVLSLWLGRRSFEGPPAATWVRV
jgi:hypothetical protein